eukprot:2394698-Rhodomonas_salina.3
MAALRAETARDLQSQHFFARSCSPSNSSSPPSSSESRFAHAMHSTRSQARGWCGRAMAWRRKPKVAGRAHESHLGLDSSSGCATRCRSTWSTCGSCWQSCSGPDIVSHQPGGCRLCVGFSMLSAGWLSRASG